MGIRPRILFNGDYYYRNPKTGYYESAYDHKTKKRSTKRLHREMYKFYTGQEIPSNFHVHHKDGNKDNNTMENFELLSHSEHAKRHGKETAERWKLPEMREANARGREKCKEWHHSEEGRKWHSEHQKQYIAKLHITKICPDCGREFNTPHDHREQTICRKCRDRNLKRELRKKAKGL